MMGSEEIYYWIAIVTTMAIYFELAYSMMGEPESMCK